MSICRTSCRVEIAKVEASEISISEWENFLKSPIWAALSFEIKERDKYLMELLRYGDPDKVWTDIEIRNRINELEYFDTLPSAIIADLKLAEAELQNRKDK